MDTARMTQSHNDIVPGQWPLLLTVINFNPGMDK